MLAISMCAMAMTVGVGAGAMAASAPASARDDSTQLMRPMPPDTATHVLPAPTIAPAPKVAVGPRKPPPPPPRFSSPFWVMTRSMVLPGWGQFYNKSWPKGVAVAGGEAAFIVQIVHDTNDLNHLQSQIDAARAAQDPDAELIAVDAYNAKLNERTNHSWWLAAVVAYSMLDAYVDAHFRGFDTEFGAVSDGRGGLEPRAMLRWAF